NPLLQYAAQYWGHHARESSEQKLQDQILEFLTQDSRVSCSVQAMELPEYPYTRYSQSPPKAVPGLWVVATFGLEEIVKLLLEKKTDIEAKTSNGETALHRAARTGH